MKIKLKKLHGQLIPFSDEDYENLRSLKDAIYEVDIRNMDSRSNAQNRAYWKWATMIADTLNVSGMTIPKTIKLDTSWDSVKIAELIFKPTIKALYDKNSSTKLNKNEYDKFIDVITLAFANKGVEIPEFPSIEN